MTVVTTTATAPPPVSSMETGKGAAADEGDDGRGHRAAPAVLLLSFPRRRGRRLHLLDRDAGGDRGGLPVIRRDQPAQHDRDRLPPHRGVCPTSPRSESRASRPRRPRGIPVYEANDAVLEFPKYCSIRLFTLGAIHKVRSHSRGGGGQISRKFCSWV